MRTAKTTKVLAHNKLRRRRRACKRSRRSRRGIWRSIRWRRTRRNRGRHRVSMTCVLYTLDGVPLLRWVAVVMYTVPYGVHVRVTSTPVMHTLFSSSVTRARNPFTARRTTTEATALRRRSGRSSRSGNFDFARAPRTPTRPSQPPTETSAHARTPRTITFLRARLIPLRVHRENHSTRVVAVAQTDRRSGRRSRRSRTYRKSAARIQP